MTVLLKNLFIVHNPYLTYSNKKSSSPVMTKWSISGYRENIGNLTRQCVVNCGEEQRWEIIHSRRLDMHFEQAPSPNTPNINIYPTHHNTTWYNTKYTPILYIYIIWYHNQAICIKWKYYNFLLYYRVMLLLFEFAFYKEGWCHIYPILELYIYIYIYI